MALRSQPPRTRATGKDSGRSGTCPKPGKDPTNGTRDGDAPRSMPSSRVSCAWSIQSRVSSRPEIASPLLDSLIYARGDSPFLENFSRTRRYILCPWPPTKPPHNHNTLKYRDISNHPRWQDPCDSTGETLRGSRLKYRKVTEVSDEIGRAHV